MICPRGTRPLNYTLKNDEIPSKIFFCKTRIFLFLLWLNFIRSNRYENLLEWSLLLCKIPWKLKFAYVFMQILWFDTIIYFTLGSQHGTEDYFHVMVFPCVGKANHLCTANPFPVMTTGISLCTNSHREFPVMNTWSLRWEEGFPVMKTGFSLWELVHRENPVLALFWEVELSLAWFFAVHFKFRTMWKKKMSH